MKKNFKPNQKKTNNCRPGGKSGKRSNFSKGPRGKSTDKAEFDPDTSTNDPDWYADDPAILRDAASIPFSMATGTSFPVYNNYAIPVDEFQTGSGYPRLALGDEFVAPGVASMKLNPWFGYSDNQTDPLNVAATAVYSFVRHANSGHSNYDAPDLMLYIMSMTQIYSYINFLQRAYGTAMLYVQRNRYIPRALLVSMNINPDDIQEHLADFRYSINVLINKVSSMAVPNEFKIFRRQAFLYQNVYSEGTSIKDQLYLYNPDGFWIFTLNASNQSGQLTYAPFRPTIVDQSNTNGLFKVTDLIAYGNMMLNAVLLNEDLNIMSGDILKAYGDNNIIKVVSLSPEYTIAPIFDIAFLEQFKNATLLPTHGCVNVEPANAKYPNGIASNGMPTIIQNVATNAILSQPTLSVQMSGFPTRNKDYFAQFNADLVNGSSNYAYGYLCNNVEPYLNSVITTTTADVTPELIMENSRLISSIKSQNLQSSSAVRNIICGTEIARCVEILTMSSGGSNIDRLLIGRYICYYSGAKPTSTSETAPNYLLDVPDNQLMVFPSAKEMWKLQSFKFMPMYYTVTLKYKGTGSSTATYAELLGLNQQFDNYSILTSNEMLRLHEAALLNQLHVRSIGKIN